MSSSESYEDVRHAYPFATVNRPGAVRDAIKAFNAQPLNVPRCITTLMSILYLLNQGEDFSASERLDVFFACTKLFQSSNSALRRMVYLVVKDIAPSIPPQQSLIIISCLNKDIVSTNDVFRAHAMRLLPSVMDPSMVANVERFLKQAVVDSSPTVAAAALTAGMKLFKTSPEVIRRWTVELQQALQSPSPVAQSHAIALLFRCKASDPVGFQRLVMLCIKSPPTSVVPLTLLTRIVGRAVRGVSNPEESILSFLMMRLSDDHCVSIEAARALLGIPTLPNEYITLIMNVMVSYLNATSLSVRFANMRILQMCVNRAPELFTSHHSVPIERLINDPNRTTAMYAVTTLLKAGAETQMDKLIKSLYQIMKEISDEFRITLIGAVRDLCAKFPSKYHVMLNFLLSALRIDSDGSRRSDFIYKRHVVNCMIFICDNNPDAITSAMEVFAEVIEDCEYPELIIRLMNKIAEVGPSTPKPERYVRFIFNRTILEKPSVRAAAVTALGRYAQALPHLVPSISVLMQRSLTDADDEVRDRAVFYLSVMRNGPTAAPSLLIDPTVHVRGMSVYSAVTMNPNVCYSKAASPGSTNQSSPASPASTAGGPTGTGSGVQAAWGGPALPSLIDLEYSLRTYLASPAAESAHTAAADPFGSAHFLRSPMGPVPLAATSTGADGQLLSPAASAAASGSTPAAAQPSGAGGAAGAERGYDMDAVLNNLRATAPPEVAVDSLGPLFTTCNPSKYLDSEVVVVGTRHIFMRHMLCTMAITNSLPSSTLVNVHPSIDIDPSSGWRVAAVVPAPQIAPAGGSGMAYLLLERRSPEVMSLTAAHMRLQFQMRDSDGSEDDEELPLEDLNILHRDFMKRFDPSDALGQMGFKAKWEAAEPSAADNEVMVKLQAPCRNLKEGVALTMQVLGLNTADNSVVNVKEGDANVILMLQGTILGPDGQTHLVLARLGVVWVESHSCVSFKAVIRTDMKKIGESLALGFSC